jgi:hypothetical protein
MIIAAYVMLRDSQLQYADSQSLNGALYYIGAPQHVAPVANRPVEPSPIPIDIGIKPSTQCEPGVAGKDEIALLPGMRLRIDLLHQRLKNPALFKDDNTPEVTQEPGVVEQMRWVFPETAAHEPLKREDFLFLQSLFAFAAVNVTPNSNAQPDLSPHPSPSPVDIDLPGALYDAGSSIPQAKKSGMFLADGLHFESFDAALADDVVKPVLGCLRLVIQSVDAEGANQGMHLRWERLLEHGGFKAFTTHSPRENPESSPGYSFLEAKLAYAPTKSAWQEIEAFFYRIDGDNPYSIAPVPGDGAISKKSPYVSRTVQWGAHVVIVPDVPTTLAESGEKRYWPAYYSYAEVERDLEHHVTGVRRLPEFLNCDRELKKCLISPKDQPLNNSPMNVAGLVAGKRIPVRFSPRGFDFLFAPYLSVDDGVKNSVLVAPGDIIETDGVPANAFEGSD